MDITFQYTKMRSDFGRQPLYCEAGPVMCDSIPVAPVVHTQYTLRNPVHSAVQHAPAYSQHRINTYRAEMATSGVNHSEGGWPKDVVITDQEATQRYRRKVEKEDGYIHCINSTCEEVDHYILQNNAVDMYSVYFLEMAASKPYEVASCRTLNEYRAPEGAQPVSSVCWQPEGHQFAVTHAAVSPTRAVSAPYYSYIWDAEKANAPTLRLQPPCPLLDLQYNSREANTLAAGMLSGQVAAWDVRAGPLAQLVSEPHTAHRDLVRQVLFINAKSGQEFFSAGPDGCCKWWDLRALAEPTDEMIIDLVKSANDEPSMARANGVSALEFEPTIPTRFMVGSENGLVIAGNRKGKTYVDKLPYCFEAHVGPVYSLQRNPGFLKNFLTVGDFTARVWSEDCRDSAVLWSPPQRCSLNDGCWSPNRSSLVLLAQSDGVLALWELLRRQHEPVLTMQVCEEPLTRIVPHAAGQLVALGSQKGSIYMVELSQNLAESDKQEKAQLNAIFEREAKRERILEARLREIKLKQKQEEEGSPQRGASASELEATLGDRDLIEAATGYFQQVKKELTYF